MAFLFSKEPLDANEAITIGPRGSDLADRVVGSVFADQAGTLYIEQSFDGTNFDVSTSITVSANDGQGFSEELIAPNVRLRYVNGAAAQTVFRLFARYSSSGPR